MGEPAIGVDCKAYYNTGTNAIPTWVLIGEAIDVSVNLSKGKPETSSRRSRWKSFGAGQIEADIELGYLHEKGADTVFDALLASFVSDTVRQYAFMDQAIATSGAQGLRAFCQCFGMPQEQALEEGVKYTFALAPTRKEEPAGTLIDPTWYEVP